MQLQKHPVISFIILTGIQHYAFPSSTLTLEKLKLLGLTLFLKDSKKSLLLLKQDKGCTLLNKNLQIIEFSSILRQCKPNLRVHILLFYTLQLMAFFRRFSKRFLLIFRMSWQVTHLFHLNFSYNNTKKIILP